MYIYIYTHMYTLYNTSSSYQSFPSIGHVARDAALAGDRIYVYIYIYIHTYTYSICV